MRFTAAQAAPTSSNGACGRSAGRGSEGGGGQHQQVGLAGLRGKSGWVASLRVSSRAPAPAPAARPRAPGGQPRCRRRATMWVRRAWRGGSKRRHTARQQQVGLGAQPRLASSASAPRTTRIDQPTAWRAARSAGLRAPPPGRQPRSVFGGSSNPVRRRTVNTRASLAGWRRPAPRCSHEHQLQLTLHQPAAGRPVTPQPPVRQHPASVARRVHQVVSRCCRRRRRRAAHAAPRLAAADAGARAAAARCGRSPWRRSTARRPAGAPVRHPSRRRCSARCAGAKRQRAMASTTRLRAASGARRWPPAAARPACRRTARRADVEEALDLLVHTADRLCLAELVDRAGERQPCASGRSASRTAAPPARPARRCRLPPGRRSARTPAWPRANAAAGARSARREGRGSSRPWRGWVRQVRLALHVDHFAVAQARGGADADHRAEALRRRPRRPTGR